MAAIVRACRSADPVLALDLDFTKMSALDSRFTFTRASAATRTKADGTLETVASGAPRFDHRYNPVSGLWEPEGLLLEPQRTNLAAPSEALNLWSEVNGATAEAASPICGLTAYKVNSGAGQAYRQISVASDNLSTYAASFLCRSEGARYGLFEIVERANRRTGLIIDFVDGTVTQTQRTSAPAGGIEASIRPCGAGVYAVTFVAIPSTVAGSLFSIRVGASISLPASSTTSGSMFATAIGNGVDGASFTAVQVELASYATSYIPTTSAAVTRAEDVCLLPGLPFADLYNRAEGTIISEIRPNFYDSGSSFGIYRYDNSTGSTNAVTASISTVGSRLGALVTTKRNGNSPSGFDSGTSTAFVSGQVTKFGQSYSLAKVAQAWGGGDLRTGVPSADPNPTPSRIYPLPIGHHRKHRYYRRQLADADLVALTA